MGAHHAPARPAAPTTRAARLAGTGVLTASAALALTSAGSGVALAHDDDESSGPHDDDSSFLCGVLGADECSDSDDERFGSFDSDAGSRGDARSLIDRITERGGSSDSDATDRSDDADRSESSDTAMERSGSAASDRADARSSRTADAAPQRVAETRPAAAPMPSLDTPPPPGQVRTIKVPS